VVNPDKSGHREKDLGDGKTHSTDWWKDDTGSHRESYNTDSDGNISDYHYHDNDSDAGYDYQSDSWTQEP